MNVYDLPAAMLSLNKTGLLSRTYELQEKVPPVALVGFGGVPFRGEPATYLGHEVTPEFLRGLLEDALGFGGVMTYMNGSKLSLSHLSEICLERGHDWAFHTVNLTLAFVGPPAFVEMSFARDRRFHLSWVEQEDLSGPRAFTATASIKDWAKYVRNRDSEDFKLIQRYWLTMAYETLEPILPEYFNG